ncbi:cob(I)yrinic acid a,c-diamide adenosyltransferase [Candidatus Woesearchaeota archaeon]|nr:cob(I)yrinic acid a,c-diamide adenosyltransferase [Candidatus Woesearchaeota archaeon]MBW3014079.1 cob(I)yrinic acid a,c-diamide adenosyltransferase [Candidatus Woesearchaeota archaeon]
MKQVILYTGEGGGKTTSALGLAMRALGHGMKVTMIQFMKGRKDIGEYKIQNKLKNFKVYQFGKKGFMDLRNPTKKDLELMRDGLEQIKKEMRKKIDMLILDEINLACAFGLVDTKEVIDIVKKIPKRTIVVMTGRRAPKELDRIADIVAMIEDKKRPKKISARKGIEY